MTVAAWHMALHDLPDDLGVEAFGAMTRRVIYGDYEPAHVRQEAQEIIQRRATAGGDAWISQAPLPPFGEYDGPVFDAWAKNERQKRYKARDSKGNVWLVVNPAAWQLRKQKDCQDEKVRPAPIAMGAA